MKVERDLLEDLEKEWKETGRPVTVSEEGKERFIKALSVERIDFLKPHEETHLIGKLRVAEGILKERRFTWPIFSDRRTGVILDGMHRWNLMKDFCFLYMPVQHIDYLENEDILLDVWCREIGAVTEEEFQLAAREHGLEEVPLDKGKVHERTHAVIVSPNNRAYIFSERMAPQIEYYKLKGLEDRLGIGRKVSVGLANYSVEKEMLADIERPETVVIFPRPLSKKDVLDVAMRGEVFPPKTTRHIFEFRLFNIHVMPMDLQTAESHEQLAQALRRSHGSRGLNYIGRNISIDRYYEEHMLRFID